MRNLSVAVLTALSQFPAGATALPEEYAVTDITGWSAEQLAALPYFDRYVPAGTSGDYSPVARSGFGVTAGNRDFTNAGWVQGSGAYLRDGEVTSISAWLRPGYWWSYSWSRTWWDGDDYHFENGFMTHSPVRDINALGQIVGYATVPGSGDSSIGYRDHAYLHDASNGEHTDLTPAADRADPRAINDLGEIVGTWRDGDGAHAFRRVPAGGFTDFVLAEASTSHSITPTALNNRGHAAGSAIVYTVPDRDRRPFFSESGSATERLPFPSQNSPDTADINDINEHGILIGVAYKAASPYETSGVRWAKDGGIWQADDLNELLADHEPAMIIDRTIAINDAGHIIATAHPDGTEVPNTRTVLLSPDVPAAPCVTTLRPEVGATSAILRAKINAAAASTSFQFQFGDAGSVGGGSADGTAPMMAEHSITGLLPHTTYSFDARATNSAGTTVGLPQNFTTLWDWSSWSAARGMGGPSDDSNHNGLPDLVDFATGEAGAPTADVAEGVLKLTYRRSLEAAGVELKVELSDDLLSWGDATPSATDRTPDGDLGEFITVSIEAGLARRFTRLTATLP